MECVYCGGKTSVINSRKQKRMNQIWRRRQCFDCQAVFTSVEAINLPVSLLFVRKPGIHEPFQRDKLFVCVYEACGHRKDAVIASTALTATIIGKLLDEVHDASIERQQVIRVTLDTLNRFDKVAGVHYQAYHPL